MCANIKIYQVYWKEEQLEKLDPRFLPYDCRKKPEPLCLETAHFMEFFKSGRHLEAQYVGIVSPKFSNKTGIPGERFLEFIHENPGFDVYFINPFPQNAYFSFNVWEHGKFCHPGITRLTQSLFNDLNYSISIDNLERNDHSTLLYCNYWVGNEKFWNSYMNFISPLYRHITEDMPPEERKKYFEATCYIKNMPLFPFIFERMFSTLLLLSNDISTCHYSHTGDEILSACLTKSERSTVEYFAGVVDTWDRKKTWGRFERNILTGLSRLNADYSSLNWEREPFPF